MVEAPFDFHASTMRSLFHCGRQCAQAGRFSITSQRAVSDSGNRDDIGASPNIPCPADDEFIDRFAVR
jgi:hypothetical protein